ncbi:MAG TPA: selenoneine synthase SenA [Burkholderiales bacterium]|nr:selenoneine synthase SenA [Burkholderiales bacterium]
MIETDVPAGTLQQMLLDARSRSLALASDLTGAQLLGPRLSIVNPPLWELGHLAWFQERWCLRHQHGGRTLLPSIFAHADRLYDSAAVAHDTRWDLPLPGLDATLEYLRAVLERVLERLQSQPSASFDYFAQLAALHEEMHCEAFTYTRQTLGYPTPRIIGHSELCQSSGAPAQGDVEIAGGTFMLGATPRSGFVFDNEKWAHPVRIEPFSIARTCVTNSEFTAFVEDGGYARRELWSDEAWAWRVSANAAHPVYWRRDSQQWHVRHYDRWLPLVEEEPVMHVSWHEADAYCRWAGRRLPSEAEWEFAAAAAPEGGLANRRYPWGNTAPVPGRANLFGMGVGPIDVAALPAGDSAWGCRQMIGNVWEWTRDTFEPYPGFEIDPYKEYSQPWFGDHKVLRGGCFATRASLIRNTWRNFYTPDRRDVYAGFRTCA